MAGIAVSRCACVAGGVAAVASHPRVRSGQRETTQIVIERGRAPCGRGMALLTQGWESPGNMVGICHPCVVTRVARVTRRGSVGKSCRMATVAGHALMRAGQCESRLVVRPGRRLPCRCAVTLRAIRRKCRQRVIRVGHARVVGMMTRIARRWSSRVTARVTLIARGRPVRACEREPGQAVIQRRWLPARWRMALLAVR